MPNHCHNRVEFYSEDTTAILKLHAIFNKGLADDIKEPVDTVFGSFIPEPDWSKVPLAESDVKEYSFSNPRGEVGELPVYNCLLYTSPSPRDEKVSRMPSSA